MFYLKLGALEPQWYSSKITGYHWMMFDNHKTYPWVLKLCETETIHFSASRVGCFCGRRPGEFVEQPTDLWVESLRLLQMIWLNLSPNFMHYLTKSIKNLTFPQSSGKLWIQRSKSTEILFFFSGFRCSHVADWKMCQAFGWFHILTIPPLASGPACSPHEWWQEAIARVTAAELNAPSRQGVG